MTRLPLIYPPKLKKGDTIGVIAPSSTYDTKKLEETIDYIRSKGFKVVFHSQTNLQYGQFAGNALDKADAIHDNFRDDTIKAIFCTVGGNGAVRVLDKLDYNLIKANPKILVGFSDITSLLNAVSVKTGLVTFHGPTLSRIENIDLQWAQKLLDVVSGLSNRVICQNARYKRQSEYEGVLYGGNLSVLQTLIGTDYAPNLENAILLLEDINDHISRYDRMMGHMALAGWLKNLNGVILGEFIKTQDNPQRPFGFVMEEIIKHHAGDVPMLFDAPVGHGLNLATLPIGAPINLKNNEITFKALE